MSSLGQDKKIPLMFSTSTDGLIHPGNHCASLCLHLWALADGPGPMQMLLPLNALFSPANPMETGHFGSR